MTFMPPVFRAPRPRRRFHDPDVRLALGEGALGLALGALLATGLLLFDVLNLRTLLGPSDAAGAGAVLFIGAFALAFAGVGAAVAAMRAGRDDSGQGDDDEPSGGLRAPVPAYAAASRRAR